MAAGRPWSARLADAILRAFEDAVPDDHDRPAAEAALPPMMEAVTALLIEASHMCMIMRGVQRPSSWTVASSMVGVFKDNLIRHKVVS